MYTDSQLLTGHAEWHCVQCGIFINSYTKSHNYDNFIKYLEKDDLCDEIL